MKSRNGTKAISTQIWLHSARRHTQPGNTLSLPTSAEYMPWQQKVESIWIQKYQPWIFDDNRKNYLDTEGNRLPGITEFIPGMGIQSGVMMSEKGSPYMMDCLKYYQSLHYEQQQWGDIVVCRILSRLMEKYGYRYTNSPQHLETNILVEAPHIFANMTTLNADSYAWHLYYRSWGKKFSVKQQIRNHFTRIYLFAQLIYHKKNSIKLFRKILF